MEIQCFENGATNCTFKVYIYNVELGERLMLSVIIGLYNGNL